MPKKRRIRIGIKLGIVIALVLLGVLGVRTVIDTVQHYNEDLESATAYEKNYSQTEARIMEGIMSSAALSANQLQDYIELYLETYEPSKRSREHIRQYCEQFVYSNENIFGLGVYFEPDMFDGKDEQHRSHEYYQLSEGRFYVYTDTDPEFNYEVIEYKDAEWYVNPIRTGKVLATEPYYEGETLCETISYPIRYRDRVVGIVLADVNLDKFQEQVMKTFEKRSVEGNRVTLFTNTGTIVATTSDTKSILKNLKDIAPQYMDYVDQVSAGVEVVADTEDFSGNPSRLVFVPINVKGLDESWVYCSINTMATFTRDARTGAIIEVVLLLITVFGMVFVMAVLIRRMVSSPMGIVRDGLLRLSHYELDMDEVLSRGRKYARQNNEIGSMMRSLEAMVGSLVHSVSAVSGIAQTAAATAEELTATSQSTSYAATEVARAVSNIAEGATSQAEDTQKAAENIEQSVGILENTVEILEQLKVAAGDIEKAQKEGEESLRELEEVTVRNTEATRSIGAIIRDTHNYAEKISVASDMIQSISDQTNLLALNAAIEAARAGESGKGFGVVAEEIRKLAEQSAQFTEEIRKVIMDLKNKSEKAVETMTNNNAMLKAQTVKLEETGKQFIEISEAVQSGNEIAAQLDRTTAELGDRNRSIMSLMENLSGIAEENAATTQQASASVETQSQSIRDISSASENLAEIATNLQNETSRFIF